MQRTVVSGRASRSVHCDRLHLGTVTVIHFGAFYRSLQAGAVVVPEGRVKEQISDL